MVDPLARAGMRKAVLAAVTAAQVAPTIQSPGDWSTPPAKLPAVLIRHGNEDKDGTGPNGPTQFNTMSVIEVRSIVQGLTGEIALDAVEELGARVEDAIFRNVMFRALVQSFPKVRSITEVTAQGKVHFAAITMAIHCECYETFYPDVTAQLASMRVTADLTNVADPSGTYPDPPFPDAVTPAPRTQGPDGRAEGEVDVQFPQ